MRILITGGSGLLGKYLVPLLKAQDGDGNLFERVFVESPTHKELDITKEIKKKDYDLIIHAAAYTDVLGAEKYKEDCSKVNIHGTENLLKTYFNVPFVFISSEYAKNPTNFYASTKAIGELFTHLWAENYLVIRTLFKPTPFPWDKAFVDQYTQGDYVDVIAKLIIKEIFKWHFSKDRKSKDIYVGTRRKTMYDLAKRTREVRPISVKDIKKVKIPTDYL